MSLTEKAREFDNSLNDFIDRVRSAFSKTFRAMEVGGDYLWATDVFEDHVIVRQGDQYFRVNMTVGADSISFDTRDKWEPRRLAYVAEMLAMGPVRDVMVISEFKGTPPDVPFAPDVDIQELTDGDKKPVYVTLPIGKVNVRSGNKRYYDTKFVKELERQVIEKRPVGLMGHLKLADRATEFPNEAVHWVGAKLVGEFLWGKGYIPRGEARERLQRYKATKTRIATSIDCEAEGEWDESVNAYRMKADTLKLGQVDFAPADRAGIGDLAAIPHLTSEMMTGGNRQEMNEEDNDMDRSQVIREMTAEDAKILPEPVRAAVLAGVQVPEVKTVQEIRTALGLGADADVAKAVTELRQEQETQRKAQVKARIREMASDAEKGIKLDSVRGMVIELVEAKQPTTVQEAESAYQQVLELDAVKAALKANVRETMGPPQGTPVGSQQGKPKYFQIPADDAA